MANEHAGIKITADEYFIRQKEAEDSCRKRISRLKWQSLFFVAATVFFVLLYEFIPNFFILWGLFIFISAAMSISSLLLIRKEIKYYKFSLERIEEYMLTGGIVIEVPKEDYEKFDLFKSKKDKFKSKSLEEMKKDEIKSENERKRLEEQKEYERKVEEEFQKQFYSDKTDGDE